MSNETEPAAPERVWVRFESPYKWSIAPEEIPNCGYVEYARVQSAQPGDVISRADAVRATMRIGCPSSYCVCSVQIADALRALPTVQPATTAPAAPGKENDHAE